MMADDERLPDDSEQTEGVEQDDVCANRTIKRIVIGLVVLAVGTLCVAFVMRDVYDKTNVEDVSNIMNGGVNDGGHRESRGWGRTSDAYTDAQASMPENVQDSGWSTAESSSDENRAVNSRFLSAKTTPLSTVAADVDTGSYVLLRSMINDGWIDETSAMSVRVEEMVNYFAYDYGEPDGGLFSRNVAVMDCPWNENTKLVSLGFSTPDYYTFANDVGSNIVFLVDVSGSMADRGLPLFQSIIEDMARNSVFGADDVISLVTYAGEESLVFEAVPGSDGERLVSEVKALDADGSTNGEAGLSMAYDVLGRHRIEGGVNTIVMVTDGDLNVGISSKDELEKFVSEKSSDGLHLSVFGVGDIEQGDERMDSLADHGNGSYHAIDSIREGRRVMVNDMMKNFVPLADDVKVQVEFNPDVVKGYRIIGYANRRMADEDFTNFEADAGEVGPGHQFTVLYEVALSDSAQAVEDGPESDMSLVKGGLGSDWLEARIWYKPVDASEPESLSVRCSDADLAAGANDNIRKQAAVAMFGESLANNGTVDDELMDKIKTIARDVDADEDWREFCDLLDAYERLR